MGLMKTGGEGTGCGIGMEGCATGTIGVAGTGIGDGTTGIAGFGATW